MICFTLSSHTMQWNPKYAFIRLSRTNACLTARLNSLFCQELYQWNAQREILNSVEENLIEEFIEICFIAALTMPHLYRCFICSAFCFIPIYFLEQLGTENQSVNVPSSRTVCGSERTHGETAPNKFCSVNRQNGHFLRQTITIREAKK